jgi:hypothetical protein
MTDLEVRFVVHLPDSEDISPAIAHLTHGAQLMVEDWNDYEPSAEVELTVKKLAPEKKDDLTSKVERLMDSLFK